MEHCFGRHGRTAVSFFQFTFAFGGMCAFGVILGDTLPRGCGATSSLSEGRADMPLNFIRHLYFCLSHSCRYGLWQTGIFQTGRHRCVCWVPGSLTLTVPRLTGTSSAVICTLGFSYPLSLYRDIEKLGKASALALVG